MVLIVVCALFAISCFPRVLSENHTVFTTTTPATPMLNLFPRRALKVEMLAVLRTNATLRQAFCSTCKPRNCQRPILRRRCALESRKAKKCACCNFCPEKWRKSKTVDRTAWRPETTLEEVISFMEKRLPKETSGKSW